MTSLTTPLSDDELDQLTEFLDALPSPTAMNLERMDGFVCALVVGPELVTLNEYWPHILGSEAEAHGPAFDSVEQAQTIMDMLARHSNSIARTLKSDEIYVPIVIPDENGQALGNEWAKGFMHGVSLRQTSWQTFLHDEAHAEAIIPMVALARENDPDPKSRFDSPSPEKRTQLLQMMTAGIVQMYRYFAPRRGQAIASTFVRGQPKTGRNDLCPCGSGKKYKQCCLMRPH